MFLTVTSFRLRCQLSSSVSMETIKRTPIRQGCRKTQAAFYALRRGYLDPPSLMDCCSDATRVEKGETRCGVCEWRQSCAEPTRDVQHCRDRLPRSGASGLPNAGAPDVRRPA